MYQYLAHISDDDRRQTIKSHCENVAALAGRFAMAFDAKKQGELCGLSHDIGKYSDEFQQRIRGANVQVDHATVAGQFLYAQQAIVPAFCVMGHHGGLPDMGVPQDRGDEATFFGRLKRQTADTYKREQELEIPKTMLPVSDNAAATAFFTRMLFSCLVDADYLDTEAFMQGSSPRLSSWQSMQDLNNRLAAFIQSKGFLQPASALNTKRASALKACIDGGEQAPGLFSLTLPTGSGKTVSSLAFALRHAVVHGLSRIIYIIPYCSIIDQTAAIFKEILGDDVVLEHHGNIEYDEDDKRRLAAENWDMPIVVTTSVQFFESLYSNKTGRCRKLHNIANSVLIFDEAQSLPVSCLKPCVYAIGQLIKRFGCSAVLCTATQPALDGLLADLAPGIIRRELCPNTEELFSALKRTNIKIEGFLPDDELAARLQAQKQALCIVNTRKQAQKLFEMLQGDGNFCLTTLLYPKHRLGILKTIRARLLEGLPCRVVATSLIEAGVDVDFPAVFRELAGLESVLQAAGRCNREGKRDPEQSIVSVFTLDQEPPRMLSVNISALKETLQNTGDLDSPKAIGCYFNALLSLKGDNLDKYCVMHAFEQSMPFRTVSEQFKMLDAHTLTVYIPTKDNAGLISQLRKGDITCYLLRRLGHYAVAVYPYHFDALNQAGAIELLDEHSAVLADGSLYSASVGLALEPEPSGAWFV